MDRRTFFKWFGAGVGAAPAVKAVVSMPDAPVVNAGRGDERFLGGDAIVPEHTASWKKRAYCYSVVDGLLYDRIRFYPGETLPSSIRFFATRVGEACHYSGLVKGYQDTNMYQAGMLSAPREFFAQRILFAAQPSVNPADWEAFSLSSAWEFQLMCKIMAQGPMMLHGPARAEAHQVIAAFGKQDSPAIAADPLPDEVNATAYNSILTSGTFIPTQVHFAFSIRSDYPITLSTKGTGLDLLIAFQGADARAVQ